MKLKTYFSGTVEAAMELARQELGPDTMIVYSKKADKESRHLGEYEVVFALDEATDAPAISPAPPPLPAAGPYASFSSEVVTLRRQMERITGAISRAGAFGGALSPELSDAYQALLEDGLEASLAQEIVEAVQTVWPARGAYREHTVVGQAVAAELARRLQIGEAEGSDVSRRRVMAVVGPPGTGKTLSLVKLAATLGLAARRPVQILSIDNLRIGAHDQLRTYAAILGIPFQFMETTSALEHALEESQGRKLVLIDTPGYAPRDLGDARGVGAFFAKSSDIEVHLVLSATWKTADLLRAVDGYGLFEPDRLLFTRLDETASYGSILNTAIRSGLPLSYVSTGQSVPEDIEPATRGKLLGVSEREAAAAASAA